MLPTIEHYYLRTYRKLLFYQGKDLNMFLITKYDH